MERASDGARLAATANALVPRRCVRCGGAIAGRFWIVKFPDAAHEACVDWRARPFPFARELDVLRFLARRAKADHARGLLAAAGALATLKRRWPADAIAVLDEGRRVIAAARAHVVDLDHRDRQRL